MKTDYVLTYTLIPPEEVRIATRQVLPSSQRWYEVRRTRTGFRIGCISMMLESDAIRNGLEMIASNYGRRALDGLSLSAIETNGLTFLPTDTDLHNYQKKLDEIILKTIKPKS